MPQWQLPHGETYLVTGEPVIVSDLTSSISHSIELLLVAVLAVMAIALGLVFRGRPRLLPLALALLAAALTFGALSLVGASLTVAQVAVLPVLVGLARRLRDPVPVARRGGARRQGAPDARVAVREAARAGRPDDRDGGRRERGGDARAGALAGADGARLRRAAGGRGRDRVRVRADRRLGGAPWPCAAARRRGDAIPSSRGIRADGACAGAAAASWRGARAPGAGLARRARAAASTTRSRAACRSAALVHAVRSPERVLARGAGAGGARLGARHPDAGADGHHQARAPEHSRSLRNLNTLERLSGVGGEIDLMVSGSDVAKPATIEWMSSYESAMLKRFGYSHDAGLRQGQAVPGILAARPVPAAKPAAPTAAKLARKLTRRGERPARRDPAVLLPGRDRAATGAWRRSRSASG